MVLSTKTTMHILLLSETKISAPASLIEKIISTLAARNISAIQQTTANFPPPKPTHFFSAWSIVLTTNMIPQLTIQQYKRANTSFYPGEESNTKTNMPGSGWLQKYTKHPWKCALSSLAVVLLWATTIKILCAYLRLREGQPTSVRRG